MHIEHPYASHTDHMQSSTSLLASVVTMPEDTVAQTCPSLVTVLPDSPVRPLYSRCFQKHPRVTGCQLNDLAHEYTSKRQHWQQVPTSDVEPGYPIDINALSSIWMRMPNLKRASPHMPTSLMAGATSQQSVCFPRGAHSLVRPISVYR